MNLRDEAFRQRVRYVRWFVNQGRLDEAQAIIEQILRSLEA